MTEEHDYIENNLTTNVGLFTKDDMLRNFELGKQEGIKSERERNKKVIEELKILAFHSWMNSRGGIDVDYCTREWERIEQQISEGNHSQQTTKLVTTSSIGEGIPETIGLQDETCRQDKTADTRKGSEGKK